MKDYESIARESKGSIICKRWDVKYKGMAEDIDSAIHDTAEPLEKRINALEARITHFVEVDEKALEEQLEQKTASLEDMFRVNEKLKERVKELESSIRLSDSLTKAYRDEIADLTRQVEELNKVPGSLKSYIAQVESQQKEIDALRKTTQSLFTLEQVEIAKAEVFKKLQSRIRELSEEKHKENIRVVQEATIVELRERVHTLEEDLKDRSYSEKNLRGSLGEKIMVLREIEERAKQALSKSRRGEQKNVCNCGAFPYGHVHVDKSLPTNQKESDNGC